MAYVIIFWVGASLIVGIIGMERKIGFLWAFLCSIFLSPIIGLIITLLSEKVAETIAYFDKGMAYINRGKFMEALDAFNKVIEHDPNNAIAYNNRGGIKFEIKDFEGALADFNKAIKIDPQWSNPYFNRGKIFILFGDELNAYRNLQKSADLGNSEALKVIKEIGGDHIKLVHRAEEVIDETEKFISDLDVEGDNFTLTAKLFATYFMEINTSKYKQVLKDEFTLFTVVGILYAQVYIFHLKSITIPEIQDLARQSLKTDEPSLEFTIKLGTLSSIVEQPGFLIEDIEYAWNSQRDIIKSAFNSVLNNYPNNAYQPKNVKDNIDKILNNSDYEGLRNIIGVKN